MKDFPPNIFVCFRLVLRKGLLIVSLVVYAKQGLSIKIIYEDMKTRTTMFEGTIVMSAPQLFCALII